MKMILAAALLISTPALAAPAAKPLIGSRDNNAEIKISADSFQADLNTKSFTYIGNVVVLQGDTKLRANQMHVDTVNSKADKITASGNVVVDSPASGIVTGEKGIYSVIPRTVLMTGNVTLKKGKDVMRGSQLTVNLITGQAVLGGGVKSTTPGQPAQGGRVQAAIQPNSN